MTAESSDACCDLIGKHEHECERSVELVVHPRLEDSRDEKIIITELSDFILVTRNWLHRKKIPRVVMNYFIYVK